MDAMSFEPLEPSTVLGSERQHLMPSPPRGNAVLVTGEATMRKTHMNSPRTGSLIKQKSEQMLRMLSN